MGINSCLSNGKVKKSSNSRNLILFCITFILSAFGYEFLFFLLTVYIYSLTHKAITVGVFAAISFFPRIFSPLYGLLVDRYELKKVVSFNAGIVGLLIIALGFIKSIYLIYAFWFVASIFLMFLMNARTVLMTEVFPKDNYVWGNSLIFSFLNLAKLLGPLLAGTVILLLDMQILIILSSLVYFLCMMMSWMLQLKDREKIQVKQIKDIIYFIQEGMEFIWKNPHIKKLAMLAITWRLFLGLQVSLFVVYVTNYLGQTQTQYGFFMSIIALGSLVGSLIGPFIATKVKNDLLMTVGLSLHFLSFVMLGLIKHYSISLVVMFISFAIFYVTVVGIHSLRDKSTQASIRGRVYGSITCLLAPPAMISMLAGGFLTDLYGVEKVLAGSGLAAFLSVLIIGFNSKSFIPKNKAMGSGY